MTSRSVLRVLEDRLAPGDPIFFPALPRTLYVLEGEATVEFARGCARHAIGSAWVGSGEIACLPGQAGARVLRWELAEADAEPNELLAAPRCHSLLKLAADVALPDGFRWLMRCDEVAFPKGGIAYAHVHQGPGIRVCLEGGIRVETEGAAHEYAPGEAWFESGPAPVLARTAADTETRFVRCFVLPRGCKGRSSIRYVHPDDAAKPKPQRYKVLAERFIELG